MTTVFGPRAASISMLGRAAVRAHVFESALGPGTFNLLKVIAGAEFVFRSVRQGRAAEFCGDRSFIRTKRATYCWTLAVHGEWIGVGYWYGCWPWV